MILRHLTLSFSSILILFSFEQFQLKMSFYVTLPRASFYKICCLGALLGITSKSPRGESDLRNLDPNSNLLDQFKLIFYFLHQNYNICCEQTSRIQYCKTQLHLSHIRIKR